MDYLNISEASAIYFGSQSISEVYIGSTKLYPTSTDYSTEYLTFTALEPSQFKLTGNAVEYSIDNGSNWVSLASDTYSPEISSGSKIIWRATITPKTNTSSPGDRIGIGNFGSTGRFDVSGNIMSMLYGNDFINQTSLQGKGYAFYSLFDGNTYLVNASNLILPALLDGFCYYRMFSNCTSLTTPPSLPATELVAYCYGYMFQSCTSLTTAPALPATTLAANCYNRMFQGCKSLTNAPNLPATTMKDSCYAYMFQDCTSLTAAPVLMAQTLSDNCYKDMFNGCSSLNYIKCLATNISATDCTSNWLAGVAATGAFVKDASMSSWSTGTSGVPSGWTVSDNTV